MNIMNEVASLASKIKDQQAYIDQLNQANRFIHGTIYWKDSEGVYLGHNDVYRQVLHDNGCLPNLDDLIVGKTDFDLFPESVAKEYRKHDVNVFKTGKEHTYQELTHQSKGMERFLLSMKRPLYNSNQNIIGVMGNTIDFSEIKIRDKVVSLTQRELHCLAGLYMGMTAKEISRRFNLSVKTIEGYIAQLKTKLNCYTRHGIIKVAIANQLHHALHAVIES